MSDYVLREDSTAMTDSLVEVRNEAEHSQYSSGKVSNSATRDSSSFLLNQQKFEVETSQSGPRMGPILTPPDSDHQVTSGSKLDIVFDQIKVEESFKHNLKKSLTATGDSSSDQQLKGESNSSVDSVSYQTEIKEKSISSSSTRKVSAIISALDPKKSQVSAEFPRVHETVNQPFVHETPPPVELISVQIPPEIPPPIEEVSVRIPPEMPPPIELVSARILSEMPPEYAPDESSEHSASSDVKPTKKIPNYMAATLSAKAKARSLSIPKPSLDAQESKRSPSSSYTKPPPFHETLRTPQRSLSQVRRNIQGNGGSNFPRDSTGFPEKPKREWRS